MLTLIIIVLILMAICRPRRYRGFGPYHHHHGPFFGPPMGAREALMVLCAAALLITALADTEVLAAHLAMVQDGK